MTAKSIHQLQLELKAAFIEIRSSRSERSQPLKIGLFQSATSTMDLIGDAPQDFPSGTPLVETTIPAWPSVAADSGVTVALALEQTSGRGRFNRKWVSNPGSGIYLTLSFRTAAPVAKLPVLSLVAGVAACEMVRSCGGDGVLKWPNDVLIPLGAGYRKIAGILLETAPAGAEGVTKVLIGIGLNYVSDEAAAAAGGISLAETADREIGYSEAVVELINRLCLEVDGYFATAVSDPALPSVVSRWQKNSMMDGVPIRFVQNGIDRNGISRGIDTDGALLVDSDGSRIKLVSGEVVIDDVARV